jgi:toxin ParE1/3/4
MDREIIRAPEAEQDLMEIWSYIADKGSPVIADAMLARIVAALDILAAAPLIGRRRTEFEGTPRSFPVRPYIVFYEPLPKRKGILVWRVVHGARDLVRIVRKPEGNQ